MARSVVIGAGMGGLAAAIDLARGGDEVLVLEKQAAVGGKMRNVMVGSSAIAGGPTVFTMRWIFEQLFADCGDDLADHLTLVPAEILARHAWRAGGNLDLFADIDRSTDAIGAFAGAADARGFQRFCAKSAAIYHTLARDFMAAQRPSPLELVRRGGWRNIPSLMATGAARSLWRGLGDYFQDPRLRQLFARYATYVGASPFLAPATLMLIAHVELDGVWLVKGGIQQVARALSGLAEQQGAKFRFGCEVSEILAERGMVSGLRLLDGEVIKADHVIFNGDLAALPDGQRPLPKILPAERSLSAITWCLTGQSEGFPLAHHNVFFGEDYAEEFDAIFRRREICAAPTVYLCAQDRGEASDWDGSGAERFLALINAPADGDHRPLSPAKLAEQQEHAFRLMAECGLTLRIEQQIVTAPVDFHLLFPATGGALYGRANHGAMGSFKRAGALSALPGLYLAGGSVHPGAGIPMAAMSGRLAAARRFAARDQGASG